MVLKRGPLDLTKLKLDKFEAGVFFWGGDHLRVLFLVKVPGLSIMMGRQALDSDPANVHCSHSRYTKTKATMHWRKNVWKKTNGEKNVWKKTNEERCTKEDKWGKIYEGRQLRKNLRKKKNEEKYTKEEKWGKIYERRQMYKRWQMYKRRQIGKKCTKEDKWGKIYERRQLKYN